MFQVELTFWVLFITLLLSFPARHTSGLRTIAKNPLPLSSSELTPRLPVLSGILLTVWIVCLGTDKGFSIHGTTAVLSLKCLGEPSFGIVTGRLTVVRLTWLSVRVVLTAQWRLRAFLIYFMTWWKFAPGVSVRPRRTASILGSLCMCAMNMRAEMTAVGISECLWKRPLATWWASRSTAWTRAVVGNGLVIYCWCRLFLDRLSWLSLWS